MSTRPLALPTPATGMRITPFGDAEGAVIQHAGRYARECVLLAFEMIGGVERLAAWAEENPTEFYTRMFTKTITREVEMSAGTGIEDLLSALDRSSHEQPTLVMDAEIIDD